MQCLGQHCGSTLPTLLQLLVVTTVNEVLTVPFSIHRLCACARKSLSTSSGGILAQQCSERAANYIVPTRWQPSGRRCTITDHRSSTSSRGAHPRLTSPTVSMVRHVCSVLLVATAIIAVFPLGAVAGSCTKETPCIVEDRNCEGNDIQAGRSKVRLTQYHFGD